MAAIFDSLSDPKLIKLLKEGAVGILPTDTVYGLVCRAEDKQAVERLYKLKDRHNKPGTLIAANIGQLVKVGFKARYLKAVEHLWPNPLSIEIPSTDPESRYLRQNQPNQAVRIPADKKVTALLAKVGPLLTTSANAPEQKPSNTIEEAEAYFGADVDFYVDAGNLKDHQASTIIRVVDDAVEVLRQGVVKIENNGVVK